MIQRSMCLQLKTRNARIVQTAKSTPIHQTHIGEDLVVLIETRVIPVEVEKDVQGHDLVTGADGLHEVQNVGNDRHLLAEAEVIGNERLTVHQSGGEDLDQQIEKRGPTVHPLGLIGAEKGREREIGGHGLQLIVDHMKRNQTS